jgi:putative RNA 2'-phosphotransferase
VRDSAKGIVRISKFISLVLRHKPGLVGLTLDAGGWAQVDDLLGAMAKAGRPLTRRMLERVVTENDKQRFTVSDDGQRIRANYGHSVPIDLGLEPREPPEVLFHGTATGSVGSIMARGIRPAGRRYVHLSIDEPTAVDVGRRHGRPVVLRIYAQSMHERGFVFYCSESGIWLTNQVPPEFIEFPDK